VIGVAFVLPSGGAHAGDPCAGGGECGIVQRVSGGAGGGAVGVRRWEDLNLVGSEVKDPQRNFPRALVGGVSCVALVYLLFNAACFKVLPLQAWRIRRTWHRTWWRELWGMARPRGNFGRC